MNAHGLTLALGGHWHGSYGTARCPAHDDRNPSLSVSDGNEGKLLVYCHAGCDQGAVWGALIDRGLVGEKDARGPLNSQAKPGSKSDRGTDHDSEQRKACALRIWRESRPASDTVVETYLGSRGIVLPVPPSIRYHPSLRYGPTGLCFPAMVAAIQAPDRTISGIHRTFLLPDGRDKARVLKAKMMLGRCAGGAVRLAPVGPELVIGEGIETCLSVQQATGLPAWATLSTSGLKAAVLPTEVKIVIIAADADEPGEKAAQEAARRFIAEGRTVKIARPPRGMDFNDMLLQPENVVAFPGKEAAHG